MCRDAGQPAESARMPKKQDNSSHSSDPAVQVDVWSGLFLACNPREVGATLAAASRGGNDVAYQLKLAAEGAARAADISGLEHFASWMLNQAVAGDVVTSRFRDLLRYEITRIGELPGESKVREFEQFRKKLADLRVRTEFKGTGTRLGDLVPDDLLMRSGDAEDSFAVSEGPRVPSQLRSAIYSFGPTRELPPTDELAPPPPPPPTPEVWTHWMRCRNNWWTTFFGIWHGHASTRAERRRVVGAETVREPFLADYLSAYVNWGHDSYEVHGQCTIIGPIGDNPPIWNNGYRERENASGVEASRTMPAAVFFGYGVVSSHLLRYRGNQRGRTYCDGWR